jgi:hypothetical protein
MEDAGLDENIAEHTQAIDGIHGNNDIGQEEDHNAYSQEVTLNKT